MKQKLGRIVSLIMVAVMLCCSTISSQAVTYSEQTAETQSISPRLSHCNNCGMAFQIYDPDPGVGTFAVSYVGKSTFDRAKLSVKFEKRFLGVFWKTVDIDEPNDEWVCYSYNPDGVFSDEIAMDGTGTYRALFTFEVRGTDGTTDVIERTIERVYE